MNQRFTLNAGPFKGSNPPAAFSDFVELVSSTTNKAEWPLAAAVEQNILIYDGDAVRSVAASPQMRPKLMAEWASALGAGPGVIVIRAAVNDVPAIDQASALFSSMIDQQRRSGSGGGDHFARPDANDRIWNALEKHCLSDPANFARYYASTPIALACEAWLGTGYQVTSQVNRVNPGGEAQTAHRDYHLGFMTPERAATYPAHVHALSPVLTLQGAVAHCDMPVESGPTLFLPFSQLFATGYVAFTAREYQDYFDENRVQLPLSKGDAVFFNPALMHAAGANTSADIERLANLLQVSSAFGRAMESVDRAGMAVALYPVLSAALECGEMSELEIGCVIAASAEGYAFPTNLDRDPPVDGLAPPSQADVMRDALRDGLSSQAFSAAIEDHLARRLSGVAANVRG